MGNSEIYILDELKPYIREREVLWSELDSALGQEKKLKGLSSKVESSLGSPDDIGSLSDTQTSIDEMRAATIKLEGELKEVDRLQRLISGGKREIQAINDRFRNVIIGAIILALFAVSVDRNC